MLTRFPFAVVSPACLKAAEVAVMTMTMTTLLTTLAVVTMVMTMAVATMVMTMAMATEVLDPVILPTMATAAETAAEILHLVLQNAGLALCSEETLVLELKALALDCFPTAMFTSPQISLANATLAARSSETAALTTSLNQSLRASVRAKIAPTSMSQNGIASATVNVHSTETAAPTLGLAISVLDFARPKTIL